MYTIHSLRELSTTTYAPTIDVPHGALRELGPDGRGRVIRALGTGGVAEQRMLSGNGALCTALRRWMSDEPPGWRAWVLAWLRIRLARSASGAGPLVAPDGQV